MKTARLKRKKGDSLVLATVRRPPLAAPSLRRALPTSTGAPVAPRRLAESRRPVPSLSRIVFREAGLCLR